MTSAGHLPLDPAALPAGRSHDLRPALRQILKSTAFELCEGGRAIRLAGPDIGYHDLDRELPSVIRNYGLRDPGEVPLYRRCRDGYALCFEDSWTGHFLASVVRNLAPGEDLVLLHLDDHRDLMATLLARAGDDGLVDPATGARFDAAEPDTWAAAIEHGAISIGSHLTPLFHHFASSGDGAACHVRHLVKSQPEVAAVRQVRPTWQSYPLIPAVNFASVEIGHCVGSQIAVGSYAASEDARSCLNDLPAGRLVVHVDLDYFVNDFNGNPGTPPVDLSASDKRDVLARMDAAFAALAAVDRPVARWIIATSPGFCAARHWRWLLDELDRRRRSMPATDI